MKLPKNKYILIMGFKFDLIFTDQMSKKELGRCDFTNQKIFVSTKQGNDSIRDTLLHEIIHGVAYLMGLDDEDTEEAFVGRIATGLRLVIKDNAWLNSFIFANS
tara:strand:+ start:1482 stop:1793 length:312 start_codon:yes stop_codon:yes gene_type:complete